jgi:hypothetical protein
VASCAIIIKRRRDRTPKVRPKNFDSANRRAATGRWRKSRKPLCYPLPQLYAPASSIAPSSTGFSAVPIFWPYDIDTTTPTGKLLFQITGAFAEFERSMIRQRIRAGLSVIKEKIVRDGKFVSKAGKVRRKLGRPGAEPDKIDRARLELAKGIGIGKVAREVGLGVGTVHRLKREIGAYAA